MKDTGFGTFFRNTTLGFALSGRLANQVMYGATSVSCLIDPLNSRFSLEQDSQQNKIVAMRKTPLIGNGKGFMYPFQRSRCCFTSITFNFF